MSVSGQPSCSSASTTLDLPECPICYQILAADVGQPDKCEHLFCLDCIQQWSRRVSTCPIDRTSFANILVKNSKNLESVLRKVGELAAEDKNVTFLWLQLAQIRVRKRTELVLPEDDEGVLLVDDLLEDDLPGFEQLACNVCGASDRDDELLLCDGCDEAYHMGCLLPPLERLPRGEWFCPVCAPDFEGSDDEEEEFDVDEVMEQIILPDLPSSSSGPVTRQRSGRRPIAARTRAAERVRAVVTQRRYERGEPVQQRACRKSKRGRKRKTRRTTSTRRPATGAVAEPSPSPKRGKGNGLPQLDSGAGPAVLRLFGPAIDVPLFSDEIDSPENKSASSAEEREYPATSDKYGSDSLLDSILTEQTQLKLRSHHVEIGRDGKLKPKTKEAKSKVDEKKPEKATEMFGAGGWGGLTGYGSDEETEEQPPPQQFGQFANRNTSYAEKPAGQAEFQNPGKIQPLFGGPTGGLRGGPAGLFARPQGDVAPPFGRQGDFGPPVGFEPPGRSGRKPLIADEDPSEDQPYTSRDQNPQMFEGPDQQPMEDPFSPPFHSRSMESQQSSLPPPLVPPPAFPDISLPSGPPPTGGSTQFDDPDGEEYDPFSAADHSPIHPSLTAPAVPGRSEGADMDIQQDDDGMDLGQLDIPLPTETPITEPQKVSVSKPTFTFSWKRKDNSEQQQAAAPEPAKSGPVKLKRNRLPVTSNVLGEAEDAAKPTQPLSSRKEFQNSGWSEVTSQDDEPATTGSRAVELEKAAADSTEELEMTTEDMGLVIDEIGSSAEDPNLHLSPIVPPTENPDEEDGETRVIDEIGPDDSVGGEQEEKRGRKSEERNGGNEKENSRKRSRSPRRPKRSRSGGRRSSRSKQRTASRSRGRRSHSRDRQRRDRESSSRKRKSRSKSKDRSDLVMERAMREARDRSRERERKERRKKQRSSRSRSPDRSRRGAEKSPRSPPKATLPLFSDERKVKSWIRTRAVTPPAQFQVTVANNDADTVTPKSKTKVEKRDSWSDDSGNEADNALPDAPSRSSGKSKKKKKEKKHKKEKKKHRKKKHRKNKDSDESEEEDTPERAPVVQLSFDEDKGDFSHPVFVKRKRKGISEIEKPDDTQQRGRELSDSDERSRKRAKDRSPAVEARAEPERKRGKSGTFNELYALGKDWLRNRSPPPEPIKAPGRKSDAQAQEELESHSRFVGSRDERKEPDRKRSRREERPPPHEFNDFDQPLRTTMDREERRKEEGRLPKVDEPHERREGRRSGDERSVRPVDRTETRGRRSRDEADNNRGQKTRVSRESPERQSERERKERHSDRHSRREEADRSENRSTKDRNRERSPQAQRRSARDQPSPNREFLNDRRRRRSKSPEVEKPKRHKSPHTPSPLASQKPAVEKLSPVAKVNETLPFDTYKEHNTSDEMLTDLLQPKEQLEHEASKSPASPDLMNIEEAELWLDALPIRGPEPPQIQTSDLVSPQGGAAAQISPAKPKTKDILDVDKELPPPSITQAKGEPAAAATQVDPKFEAKKKERLQKALQHEVGEVSSTTTEHRLKVEAKVQFQLEVEAFIKSILKPCFARKEITKDEYKTIMKRTVPEICKKSRSQRLNQSKVQRFVEQHIQKVTEGKSGETEKPENEAERQKKVAAWQEELGLTVDENIL